MLSVDCKAAACVLVYTAACQTGCRCRPFLHTTTTIATIITATAELELILDEEVGGYPRLIRPYAAHNTHPLEAAHGPQREAVQWQWLQLATSSLEPPAPTGTCLVCVEQSDQVAKDIGR